MISINRIINKKTRKMLNSIIIMKIIALSVEISENYDILKQNLVNEMGVSNINIRNGTALLFCGLTTIVVTVSGVIYTC